MARVASQRAESPSDLSLSLRILGGLQKAL